MNIEDLGFIAAFNQNVEAARAWKVLEDTKQITPQGREHLERYRVYIRLHTPRYLELKRQDLLSL